jgi:hypothetical protein
MSIVFVTNNPFQADEIVYVTDDPTKADETIYVKCTPYKVDKTVYIVAATPELRALERDMTTFREVAADLRRLKTFSYRNAGVRKIDRIVFITGDPAEAHATSTP